MTTAPGDNRYEDAAFPVGELSRRTGLSAAAINYYVNLGLLPRPRKTGRTRALYSELHERAILRIKELQGRGLPLRVIKKVLSSKDPASELGLRQLPDRVEGRSPEGRSLDAISLEQFLERSGLSLEHYGDLSAGGLLRSPRRIAGIERALNSRDLEAARSCAQLLSAGVSKDVLLRHAEFELLAKAEAHFLAEHVASSGKARQPAEASVEIEAAFDSLRRYMRRLEMEYAYPNWLPG